MEGIQKQQCSSKQLTLYGMDNGNNSRDIHKYFIVLTNYQNNN